MRLIDADALKEDLTRFYDNEVTARKLIDEQPTVGEWVSVKDRTPEAAGYKCIVCAVNTFGQKDVFIAFTGYGDMKWYTMDTTKIGKFVHSNNDVSEAWTITHWMPLPEPPKEG